MEIILHMETFQIRDDLMLRLVINAADDTPVAMATTVTPFSTAKNTIRIKMSLIGLAPGKYKLKPAVYLINEYGAEQHLDVIVDAASFLIIQKDGGTKLAWNKTYWGYLQLPDLEIKNV